MTYKKKERIQNEYDKIEKSIINIVTLTGNDKVNNLYYEDMEVQLQLIKNYINQAVYKIIAKAQNKNK